MVSSIFLGSQNANSASHAVPSRSRAASEGQNPARRRRESEFLVPPVCRAKRRWTSVTRMVWLSFARTPARLQAVRPIASPTSVSGRASLAPTDPARSSARDGAAAMPPGVRHPRLLDVSALHRSARVLGRLVVASANGAASLCREHSLTQSNRSEGGCQPSWAFRRNRSPVPLRTRSAVGATRRGTRIISPPLPVPRCGRGPAPLFAWTLPFRSSL